MRTKEIARIARKLLVLVFVFSLLQSHMFILNEFAGTAYAVIGTRIEEDSKISSEIIDDFVPENTIFIENVISEVENVLEQEESNELLEPDIQQTEQDLETKTNKEIQKEAADEFIEADDDAVENTTTDDATGTDSSAKNEEVADEKINSTLKIFDAYRSLNGIVIKANIVCEIENLKDAVKESKINLAIPVAEEYTAKNVYLEDVLPLSETSVLKSLNEGDCFVVSILDDITSEKIEYEYKFVFLFDNACEVSELSLDFDVALTYKDDETFESKVNLKEDVVFLEKEANEYSISSQDTNIYKGYLYANAISTNGYETKYTSIDKVKINTLGDIDTIVVKEDVDVINTKDGSDESLLNYSKYVTTLVKKDEFDNMFGTEGYIEIYSDRKAIGRIDSKTKIVNDSYEFEYNTQVSNVEFKFNKIVNAGNLDILNKKVIKKTTAFDRTQIMNFSNIESKLLVYEVMKLDDFDFILSETTGEVKINLEETESRMDLVMDVNTLSTSSDNDVTFTVTLRTNEDKYELFKNPEIQIKLPSDVIDVQIVNINLLYKNGLSVDSFEVVEGEYGKKIIKVKLVGTQIEYTPGLLSNGTTINLYTKIKLNRLTTNKESKVEFKYTNEIKSKISYEVEGKDSVTIPIQFVSKIGLLRALSLNNEVTMLNSTSYDTEVSELRLEDHITNQVIKYRGTIVNNFEGVIENVQIVGRIPTKGTIENGAYIVESTFSTTLNSEIITSGSIVEIFYSEELDADKDSESWTKNIVDFSRVKSFKMVLSNEEMKKGEFLEFSCDIEVQDNLENNHKAYATYDVYYDLDGQTLFGYCTTKMVTDEKEITMEDIPEEDKSQVAELVIGTIATKWQEQLSENDEVFERQALEYTIVVTNNSNVTANNIRIQANAENANLYYMKTWIEPNYQDTEEYELGEYVEDIDNTKVFEEFKIDTLAPNETKIFKYQVIVKDLKDIEKPEVYGKIKVLGDNFEEVNINTIKNKIVDADISVLTAFGATENPKDSMVYAQAPLRFKVAYTNLSDEMIEGANMKIFISKELELNVKAPIEGAEEFEKTINEVVDGTIVNIVIPEMKPGETNYFNFYAVAKDFDTNLLEKQVNIYAVVDYKNNLYYSNNYTRSIYQGKSKVEYTWKADRDVNEILVDGDVVRYIFTVKNIGLIDINELSADFNIDNGLSIRRVIFSNGFETVDLDINKYNKSIVYDFALNVGEEAKLEYEFMVDDGLFEINQSTIETRIDVTSSRIDGFTTDVILFKVKNELKEESFEDAPNLDEDDEIFYFPEEDKEQIEDEVIEVQKTYKISGKVWLDKNKDGMYSQDEVGIKGIGVYAYGANDGEINMDLVMGSCRTDDNGKYVFDNLPAGKYIIAFGYDNSLYTVTKYQIAKAKSNENSDAIIKDFLGDNKYIGMTDTIELVDRTISDIDMGLIQLNDFDMALEKYIAEITVRNSIGKKVHEYEDESLVKLEINSKLFEKSVVDIEYKIVVKNEGELAGYVNRIVDYLPEGLNFSIEKNPYWSKLEDNRLVYTGLIDKKINPGETREISLILTLDIDNSNAKEIVNTAEILEGTNDRGFQDIDSITGNNVEYEDDFGRVALLITVSTGRMINYGLIIITFILIIGVLIIGMYIFKEKIYK